MTVRNKYSRRVGSILESASEWLKCGLDEPQVIFNGVVHALSLFYTNPMLICL